MRKKWNIININHCKSIKNGMSQVSFPMNQLLTVNYQNEWQNAMNDKMQNQIRYIYMH